METIYTVIVVILLVLAILGLVVGVSNDAVNFLNSAIGSKAASRKVIFTIASVGILLGTMTSSGMMEVARSGVFYPEMFTFRDVMMLFLGVMFANVILLDLFNTFGLPTSTTVSLVFGLLGAAVAVTSLKISADPTLTAADMSNYINSGKALVIISGILASVAIAFVVGAFVMFISRLIFTFRYQKMLKRFGALWCGIAFTAIAYFALFKGLQDSGIFSPAFFDTLSAHMFPILLGFFAVSSLVMFLLQLAKINILKVTILAGTFSLALAFAGNDLVNFIGVPIAGLDSYKIALAAGGDDGMMMGKLSEPVPPAAARSRVHHGRDALDIQKGTERQRNRNQPRQTGRGNGAFRLHPLLPFHRAGSHHRQQVVRGPRSRILPAGDKQTVHSAAPQSRKRPFRPDTRHGEPHRRLHTHRHGHLAQTPPLDHLRHFHGGHG